MKTISTRIAAMVMVICSMLWGAVKMSAVVIDTAIDEKIPYGAYESPNTFAVIIGNENYESVEKVPYAVNDANTFAAYCETTLGIPKKHIKIYNDATYGRMMAAVDYIRKIAGVYKGDLNVVFYYAGHGIPSENSGEAYLLPIDATGDIVDVCYPLNKLYKQLGEMNARRVVVFLDACFSGAQRGSGMLRASRGVAIKAKGGVTQGNMVVFSAATDAQTAYPYEEKGHGLFTYYLLKKLNESRGDVSLGELDKYISEQVSRTSIVENGKVQTPVVASSASLADWRSQSVILGVKSAVARKGFVTRNVPRQPVEQLKQSTPSQPNRNNSVAADTPKQPQTAPASGSREFTVKGVKFTMVAVEGGTFTMGATQEQGGDAYDDEKPAHQVTLSDYMIGQTEVTQELWQAVMGGNPSYFKGDKRPVEYMSWKDCQEFIENLNALTGERFRLPTEAEWEYAARGGNKSRGYKYSGSDNFEDVAWYYFENGYENTHIVATKKANELGIYDMSGNVWEWCSDWYGKYSSGSQTNPTGPDSGSDRVYRGGSWSYRARDCRVSIRSCGLPAGGNIDTGLRLALIP